MGSKDRWIFLFALGVVLFNWPFITLFREAPALLLFVAWGLFIGAAALAGRNRS